MERPDGCSTHFGLLSPKTFDSYFVDMMYVEFMKNFLHADSNVLMAVTFVSYFLEMMHVGFMKNFLLPDSSQPMAVRLISAS